MKWVVLTASIVAAVSTVSTAPVYANDLTDTVRARANARAGGPTNGHDAWILDRYGKLSGTRSATEVVGTSLSSYKVNALQKLRSRY